MLKEESGDSEDLSQLMHSGKEAKIPLASSHHQAAACLPLSAPPVKAMLSLRVSWHPCDRKQSARWLIFMCLVFVWVKFFQLLRLF